MSTVPASVFSFRGIILAALAFFFFTVMDSCIKQSASHYGLYQISFILSVISVLFFLIYRAFVGKPWQELATKKPVAHLLRSVVMVAANLAIWYSFKQLPLANVYGILFVNPIAAVLFSALLLKESMSKRQVVAIIIGFLGVMLIVKPQADAPIIPMLAVLLATVASCLTDIMVRKMRHSEHVSTFIVYPLLAMGVFNLVFGYQEFTMPTISHWLWLIAAGAAMILAQIFLINAFMVMSTPLVSPFRYTQMIWGLLAGYFLFGDVPDQWMLLGSAIVVISGLYVLNVERKKGKVA
ncbi:MAG: DMT family transporter [Alphaproteobacteria bacterium]